ncbi:hypothetical protein HNP38_001888 [Chryseobacterium defluvii]|uniref:Glycosyl transferase family 2 n=1 Tax=Chryseobacterium defluvii TaxID=160396 RepID=A0A840KI63_9FLAO|nr:hypothetical protein [Chryseobacterium defluvii]MBB4806592.1 hypothetical protein [Chryseobacterium defluvii]
MKNAIVTYIYPKAVQFIEVFIENINKIPTQDIQLIIFNDGLIYDEKLFSKLCIPYCIIPTGGTINEVRHHSFEYLYENFTEIENMIFQDIDDVFSENRFDILIEKLRYNKIVCNDLSSLENGRLKDLSLWAGRLGNDFEFDHHFIKNKNILGLGNTGMKREVLNIKTFLSNQPAAYDWFYFYQILKLGNIKASFTSECQTHYMQHTDNIAGVNKEMTADQLQHIITVKKKQYESLIDLNFNELEEELDKLNNIKDINPSKIPAQKNFFWWEETETL